MGGGGGGGWGVIFEHGLEKLKAKSFYIFEYFPNSENTY